MIVNNNLYFKVSCYNMNMQQYFVNEKLSVNTLIDLNEEILKHTKVVLRKKDGYKFRVIDVENQCFLVELKDNQALVLEYIEEDHELPIDVTVVMSLIKNEKFDLTLQKLTELGVKRIVPFSANRSIIKIKDEDKKIERFKKIVTEASEQCHREVVPEITNVANLKDIVKYMSKYNYIAYEKEETHPLPFRDVDDSLTVVIGPEGGFEKSEVEALEAMGFECKTLGKRILRAETAAIFVMSNIVGVFEL